METLARLTAFDTAHDEAIDTSVASIIADVRARGDAALLEYTALFTSEVDRTAELKEDTARIDYRLHATLVVTKQIPT